MRAECGCSPCQGQGLSVFFSTLAEEGIIKESLGLWTCASAVFHAARANSEWHRGRGWHPRLFTAVTTPLLIEEREFGDD